MYAKGVVKGLKRVKRVNKNDNVRHVLLDFSEKTALTYISATKRDIFFRRFSARLYFLSATKRDSFCADLLTFVKLLCVFVICFALFACAHCAVDAIVSLR